MGLQILADDDDDDKIHLLTLSAASGLSGFLSGWYFSASLRYVFLISSAVAVFGTPNSS